MDEIPPSPFLPEQTTIGQDTLIPRIISGLWQLAGGHDEKVDVHAAARTMQRLIDSGFNCFDMADHYGDAGTTLSVEQCALVAANNSCQRTRYRQIPRHFDPKSACLYEMVSARKRH